MQEESCHWQIKSRHVESDVTTQEEYENKAIAFIKQPVGGDVDGYLRKPEPGTDKEPVIVRFNRKTFNRKTFNRKTGEIGTRMPHPMVKIKLKGEGKNMSWFDDAKVVNFGPDDKPGKYGFYR